MSRVVAPDEDTWYEIDRAITHPDYDPIAYTSQFANDVGVIILKKPVNIRKVPLANLPYQGLLDDLRAAGLLRVPG